MEQKDLIQKCHGLEISLLRLERQIEENKAALQQAKFDLREAKIAQAEYSGSFKSFRDKLTGKQESTEVALRHAVQKAEAELTAAQRQKELLEVSLSDAKTQLTALPSWESLRDGSDQWYRLEALYCIEVLAPMLETNRELLTERRNQFNGSNAGEIKSRETLAEIYSAPEAAGEACRPYLLRLKAALEKLEIPFELHSYFDAPTAFLSSATKFTRMDRVNTATQQVQTLLSRLPNLQTQITE